MKRKILYFQIISLIIFSVASCSKKAETGYSTKYNVIDNAIVGKNIGTYNNRPLYVNNSDAFILTGDQPVSRLAKEQNLYGTFMLGIIRDGKGKWIHQFDQIISEYRPGRMLWKVSDSLYPGLNIIMEVLPMANTTGMAINVRSEGTRDGDRLIWAFGGAQWKPGQNLAWRWDVTRNTALLKWDFTPGECRNNQIETDGNIFFITVPDSAHENDELFRVAIKCNSDSESGTGEALLWNDPAVFNGSQADSLPVLKGIIIPDDRKTIYWAFEAFNKGSTIDLSKVSDAEIAFTEGVKRTESFENRLKINTPDPYLNAAARASVAAIDGTWHPPVFVHGAMAWSVRFPGWRTIFGGTMYGWHDRVMDEAKFYIDAQVTESDKKEAKADPKTLLTEQHPDSRFYGVGHIDKDQRFYDMQSQFFDQIVEEYRWTDNPVLVKFFRNALELHLLWMRECFDPDGDGVYESYINVWPTDSQWYNGGGTAEETSYAYRGHLAARDMARNEGDKEAEEFHTKMLEKIRKGFFEKLWISSKGHSGSYLEQGGHGRLHENPWLYSIFLPVDAGLTSHLQAIESVYYSEWALENDTMPSGGRKVWTSNWVPHIWSIRELWPGDNYHLALSYYQAGLPEDAWEIFRGSFMYSAFDYGIPGNLGDAKGGIDFGDCIHPFSRTLVSGLFGYNPDYPDKKVTIRPRFPAAWDHASIELPDVRIAFTSGNNKTSYRFELTQGENTELLLPVRCKEIKAVMVNGIRTNYDVLADAGQSIVKINLPEMTKAEVIIKTGKSLPYYNPVSIEGNIGENIRMVAENAQIIEFEDPQDVLENEKIENGILSARLTSNKGYHTVLTRSMAGNAPQLRIFRIKVNDPEGDARIAERFLNEVPEQASWEPIDINPLLNADVRTIYQQKYLSPRPNTVSCRLGSDGYSPWTFWHWKSPLPVIRTDKVADMLDENKRLITPQGVPFEWNPGSENIAFTSMWDNYPAKIDFPVNKKGDAVYFLVCGSTNVMQCQIANAVLRLNYADGNKDSLELVPPVNYWNLSIISSTASSPEQDNRADYTSETDRFCLPAVLPERVQLGENCRAMLLNIKLRKDTELKSITLETLSQEVVVGLMGITLGYRPLSTK
ncbi:MAG TPA: hypothetical protein DDW27_21285 [Bacteroidales bacterium]|nr:hypothetical protein [Bacteroidales bacterium]